MGMRLNEQAKEYVNRIQEAANKMNRLVNDLLEFSRVSRAKLPLTPVDMSKVTEESPPFAECRNFGSNSASIQVDPDLGVVIGHESTLTQVMLNLVGNALRLCKIGRSPSLHIRAELRSSRIRICVDDNGIGVAPEFHQKIFEISNGCLRSIRKTAQASDWRLSPRPSNVWVVLLGSNHSLVSAARSVRINRSHNSGGLHALWPPSTAPGPGRRFCQTILYPNVVQALAEKPWYFRRAATAFCGARQLRSLP
jgi:hypothetical protein